MVLTFLSLLLPLLNTARKINSLDRDDARAGEGDRCADNRAPRPG